MKRSTVEKEIQESQGKDSPVKTRRRLNSDAFSAESGKSARASRRSKAAEAVKSEDFSEYFGPDASYGVSRGEFPFWMLCLVLFAVILIVTAFRIPAIMRGDLLPNTEQSESSVPVSDLPGDGPVSSEEDELSNGGPEGSGTEAEAPFGEDAGGQGAFGTDGPEDVGPGSAEIVRDPTDGPAVVETGPESVSAVPETASFVTLPEWGHIHRYHDGVCTVCGEKPEFYTAFLPEGYFGEAEHKGTVETHEYQFFNYLSGYGNYNKVMSVYLPYGYDPSKPYNVLMLMHGALGDDEKSWLVTEYSYGERTICGKDLLDHMIENGICDPCIVVCPLGEFPECQGQLSLNIQMEKEMPEYILPYIAEHYSTYAKDGSLDSIRAARDHFALGGVSNGALFVYEVGIRYMFDLFGSYMALSGNGQPWNTLHYLQLNEDFQKLPFNCYFTGAGTINDFQQYYTEIGYNYYLENEPRLTEGVNAWRVDVEGGAEWKVWLTDLFNAMPLMFQS